MSENGGREQPRSGERMQPTAQAVGGAPTESQPWRGGRQMSHTCGNILLHLIFSTRERHPLIKPEFRSELFAYLGGIVREMHGTALIISGTADHVHMLVRTRPAQAPAELARVVKTNSSRWVREKWSSHFGWQTGYGVFSVSESDVTAVKEEWDRHGREIYLGLVSFAPLGLASSLYSTHGLRRGLHSFAA